MGVFSTFNTSSSFPFLLFSNSSKSLGDSEKKATSDPETKAEIRSKTIRAIVPVTNDQFRVISKETNDVLEHYPTSDKNVFLEITSMPSYPNDEGTVVLLNDSGLVVDRVEYNADFHHVIIKNPEGISLERLDYERPSTDETNWHSAAETVGFATPGVENSQFVTATDFSENVTLEPQTFSPDNDGFDDVLNINYSFDAPGAVANVEIVDTDGRQVYTLTQNEVLATSGTITWDGATDSGLKARSGMYIIYFEIFDDKGNTQHFKKACVLALKF